LITDELRALIREHKALLLEELRSRVPVDMTPMFAAALQTGRLVICRTCGHFAARPSRQPDGWCDLHGETWAAVPFDCPEYEGIGHD
jgi:hypothetical protein